MEGDLCEVTVENPEEILPGIYTARAAELTGSSAGNYVLPEGREVSCTIGKRQAVLTWSGLEKTYDGAPAEVKAEVSNLVAGDTCEAQVQGVDAVNAGTYTAVAVLDNEKYELAENAQQSYTILPKAVHVIWAAADKTYDGSAAEVTANADAADLVGTDSCGILIENAQEIHAGTYSAKAVGTTNAGSRCRDHKSLHHCTETHCTDLERNRGKSIRWKRFKCNSRSIRYSGRRFLQRDSHWRK